MITDTLPDTLAGLLEVAIRDLKLVEQDPRYEIDMGTWHDPFKGEKCCVCLAGACLAQCGVSPTSKVDVLSLEPTLRRKLRAIDCLRCGYIIEAYHYIYDTSFHCYEPYITPYSENRDEFFKDLENLLAYLKKEGI